MATPKSARAYLRPLLARVEREAIRRSAEGAGARDVRPIEEPMAAVIGAGMKVEESGRLYGCRYWRWHDRDRAYIAWWGRLS